MRRLCGRLIRVARWWARLPAILLLSSLLPAPALAFAPWDFVRSDIDWSGYLRNETAYRYREPRSYTKIRNTLFLEGKYAFNDTFELTGSGWAYYDLVYDLFDYNTIAARSERDIIQPLTYIEGLAEEKDSPVLDVREFYLDIFLNRADIRVGKQFVIWGVLTGVRVVDEINPMDFRELILLDLLDYRIPLWTFKADYYLPDSSVQVLWIPDIRFHKPAPRGSEWELLQEVPGTIYPESFTLENSEVGLRYSWRTMDTDLTLSYFYTWDDFPVIFRTVFIDTGEAPTFEPTFTRMHMYGATFQRSLGGQVIKGEVAYVRDKYFGTVAIDRNQDGIVDHRGELQKDHIRWGLGFDFNLWKTDFSPGVTQWIILDYQDEIIQDRFDTSVNLFVRKELPEYTAVMEILGVFLINMKETYLRPKVTFNVTERFQIAAGLDLFSGKTSQAGVGARGGRATDLFEVEQRFQFIGNFHENDRLFIEFKYAF